jgi:hypothetical protein
LFGKYFKYCSDYEQMICLGQMFSLAEVCTISNATRELYELKCHVVQHIDAFYYVPMFLKFHVLDLVYGGERSFISSQTCCLCLRLECLRCSFHTHVIATLQSA